MIGLTLDPDRSRIIDVLVADARRSASEVGRLVGLSPPAAKRRIDRLETDRPDPRLHGPARPPAAGEQIEAFIELRFAPGTQVAEVDTAVTDLPEVIESFTLAGDPDALAHVRVVTSTTSRASSTAFAGAPGGPKILTTRTVIVLGRTQPTRVAEPRAPTAIGAMWQVFGFSRHLARGRIVCYY